MERVEADHTGRWSGRSLDQVRVTSVDDVVAVVRAGSPITVAGGRTSLVAGAVPADTVVLETAGLARLDGIDLDEGTVVVGAGVTLAVLQGHAAVQGLSYGIDLAARDACTVGGTVATNAVGLQGVAFGATRAQVVGLEAVLADGSVVSSLERPAQTSLGPDWAQLLVGSEGTLGVVTAARLRLLPADASRALGGFPAASPQEALRVLRAARAVPGLRSVEWVSPEMAALAGGPFPGYVLVEVGASSADGALEALSFLEPEVAAVDADRQRLWAPREACSEVVVRHAASISTVAHKLDVAVPLARLAEVVEGLPPGTPVFGHIGVGTLHVTLFAPEGDDADDAVLRHVVAGGGAVAAEHGVGRAKVRWLGLSRSPAEMSLLRSLKSALDPQGLLNPGVLLA